MRGGIKIKEGEERKAKENLWRKKEQRTNLIKEKGSLTEDISFSFIIKTNRIIKMAVGFWNFLFFLISVFRFYLHWLDFDGNIILFPGKQKLIKKKKLFLLLQPRFFPIFYHFLVNCLKEKMPFLGWKLFGLNCLYFKPVYDKCDNPFFVGCTALKENKILVFCIMKLMYARLQE